MKRSLIITILIFLCLSVSAQDEILSTVPVKDGKLIYEGVIDAPGKSKLDLYNNAKQWFIDNFISSRDVIQNEDKEQGEIIGKGVFYIYLKNLLITSKLYDRITIQVDCKDNKYRYKIYDMTIAVQTADLGAFGYQPPRVYTDFDIINKLNGGKVAVTKSWCKKTLVSIDEETKLTIASLSKAMENKPDNF